MNDTIVWLRFDGPEQLLHLPRCEVWSYGWLCVRKINLFELLDGIFFVPLSISYF